MPTVDDQAAIDAQLEKLEQEHDEAIAKIIRLDKQKKFFRTRKQKMIAAGLSSIDELDALEEEEEKERKAQEISKTPGTQSREAGTLEFDPNFDFSSFDPSSINNLLAWPKHGIAR